MIRTAVALAAVMIAAGGTPARLQDKPPMPERVVLYEEDPSNAAGKRYLGSAIWRTEMVTPTRGQPAELAVRCDVEIPGRGIAMTFSMRRNVDQALPASHTIEIMFNLPKSFPFGGIASVPGILLKEAETSRGTPLAGLTVKVQTGFFLIGLSATETERGRNLQLLKTRAWFDIPVVYNNGRRAIIAAEKGGTGDRAFAEAFEVWETPGFKEKCDTRGKPSLGMSKDDVISTCWGRPLSTERVTTAEGTRERLIYKGGNYLEFQDGKLVTISERE